MLLSLAESDAVRAVSAYRTHHEDDDDFDIEGKTESYIVPGFGDAGDLSYASKK